MCRLLLLVALVGLAPLALATSSTRKNVLMIAIDDMRPELSPYGFDYMHTPNIQRLADRGTVFQRAYVQVALCMPSRTALLTTRRPDTTKNWLIAHNEWFRDCGGPSCPAHVCDPGCGASLTTLPQMFKDKLGYTVKGAGKIFHEGSATDFQDYKYSWTDPVGPPTGIYDQGELKPGLPSDYEPCLHAFPDNETLQDDFQARHGVELLKNLSASPSQNFFVAVGFHKPHVPWYFPQRFYDYYPNASVDLAPNKHLPINVPQIALQNVMRSWSTCGKDGDGGYTDLCTQVGPDSPAHMSRNFPYDNTTLPDWKAHEIRRAYRAAISYTDYNIGLLLDALDASPFANNTVVALWGDHGYQLGDNDGLSGQTPGKSPALVEEVDLFPTLVEAATDGQVTIPQCPSDVQDSRRTALCTEGFSLMPLIAQPDAKWPHASFSQYNRENEKVMGYTMRTNSFRYTLWVNFNSSAAEPDFTSVVGRELYSHERAPVPVDWAMEHENVAEYPAYADIRHQMHMALVKCAQRPFLCAANNTLAALP